MSHKKSYANASLHQYLGELGSSRPSPGGGSAAALCGTLGIALLEMVSGINDKREKKVSSKPAA
jgi:methenyltetrahydrofolate cyclohydrolase